MNHSAPVVIAGDIALMVAWAIMLTFVVRYLLFSPWNSEPTGVALMGFMCTAVAILTFGVIVLVFGGFPGIPEIRLSLYIMLAVNAGRFLRILIKTQDRQNFDNTELMKEAIMSAKEGLRRFFRREPTLYIGSLAAVGNWLVGFQFDWLTAEQAALWMTAINAVAGVIVAVKTRPIPPQAFTYAVASLAGLGAAYGLDFSQEQVGHFNAMLLGVLMFLARGQVSPKRQAPITGVLGDKVTTP